MELVRELNEGVPRILSEMKEAGLPEPKIVETAANVTVVLRNGRVNADTIQATEKILRILNERPTIGALYFKGNDYICTQLSSYQ